MNKLPLDNSYALLMVFLAPQKTEATLLQIERAAKNNQIVWEAVLQQANVQLCTPLWFSQLRKDGLLELLPSDLVEYISEIYNANEERNIRMRSGLVELLAELNAVSIDTLLIKGAATFCDDLYGDMGSRVMGDLDVLVSLDKVEQSREILIQLGYVEIVDPTMKRDGLATDDRFHQIYRHILPETPVAVEIHFKLSAAQVGRMLPVEGVWRSKIETTLLGQPTAVLSADNKLILNAAHGLVPQREFIKGQVPIRQLVEFALLLQRYESQINWGCWQEIAKEFSLSNEFALYLYLTVRYMQVASKPAEACHFLMRFDVRRVLFVGEYEAFIGNAPKPFDLKAKYWLYQCSYFLRLPIWAWKNSCYAPGWKNIPVRAYVFVRKFFTGRCWGNV